MNNTIFVLTSLPLFASVFRDFLVVVTFNEVTLFNFLKVLKNPLVQSKNESTVHISKNNDGKSR